MTRLFFSVTSIVLTFILWFPQATKAQRDITLNGQWQFSTDEKEWQTVTVPHTYNLLSELEDYAGEAAYRRKLPITAELKGQTVRVHFDAVYHDAIVYVNGKKVGEHLYKGYTPFSFDITNYLNFNETDNNVIEIKCSNAFSDKALPYKRSFDWNNDGGIYRDVRLHVNKGEALRYVHVTPCVNPNDSTGVAQFAIRLHNGKVTHIKGELHIANRQTGETVRRQQLNLRKKRDEKHFLTEVEMGKVQLWHFDDPNLYDFEFTLYHGKEVGDKLSDHFGFRQFKIEGRQFILNGEAVRLPGIETMPGSNPQYGMAEPVEFLKQTVQAMKELNSTITRFHWPQDKKMFDLMDEMGLLAQEELSWWQRPSGKLSPELEQTARETLEEMIEAHYNHPSIYGWGLSNEVSGNKEDLRSLEEFVRSLDPNRFVMAMSNHTYKLLDKDPSCFLDVPTWNEYTGTWHGGVREDLSKRLTRLDSALVGRPLFVTEGGLCEPAFTGGDARRIDDMLYHIKEWQRWPYICGYIYFSLQDYRTQMGEEGIGKWRIRRHGVMTSDLRPKASYSVLQQLSSPIEIIEVSPAHAKKNENSLAGQYEVNADNRDAHIVLSVKNSIPSYTLRGYSLRYTDRNNVVRNIPLPDLLPGRRYPFTLRDINTRFSFEIVRPGGYIVITY